jgi:hypothetical protein
VRAAARASSNASALRQATAARSAIACSVSMSSSAIGRIDVKPTESAPLSSPFQRTGTPIAVCTLTSTSAPLIPPSRW